MQSKNQRRKEYDIIDTQINNTISAGNTCIVQVPYSGVMVSKLDSQIYKSEFESHRVLN